jgi:hypothetical protein
MTHRYTLLVGGLVLPGGDGPACTAIAWADDTVLALGSDAEVDGVSRGDSHRYDLAGARVVPFGEPLEVGSTADLRVLEGDAVVAVVRAGRVVAGALPGGAPGDHGHAHH